MATTTSHAPRTVAIVVAAVLAFAAVAALVVMVVLPSLGAGNPFAGKTLYIYPDSSAAKATIASSGDDATAFAEIANTATAIWLLPEAHATADVGNFVDSVSTAAESAGQLPVFVVYGIPDRDCNNLSAGGLTEADYPAWVTAIGNGLAGHESVVILEPDSLALASQCGNTDLRISQTQTAITNLTSASQTLSVSAPTIYLDGGHSTWIDANTMAGLLTNAGIDRVRGFATNVSNYNADDIEKTYAEHLSSLTGNSHYVVDSSRNGNGSDGIWCNPTGRALGDAPTAITDGSAQDANLWVKMPGESDGECNGGPAAGQWWASAALALVRG